MTKTIIDISYRKSEIGIDMHIEDALYVEDAKQYLKSTLVELDSQELQDKYYYVINMTDNIAVFNKRPVTIYNEFASNIVEQTTKDEFDYYGDHRSLQHYNETLYNDYHQSIIEQQEKLERISDEYYNEMEYI